MLISDAQYESLRSATNAVSACWVFTNKPRTVRERWDTLAVTNRLIGYRLLTGVLYRSGLHDKHIDTALRKIHI